MAAITRHFGNDLPEIIVEPGRSIVGDAGVIQSEVVLISRKSADDEKRWVYLDVGKFNGLAETMDESIKYRISTPADGGATGPVVIAGPTCDSADILYEKTRLPPAARPQGRRQGRDPVDRRLYLELRLGRLQRLRAAQDLLHLKRRGAAAGRPRRDLAQELLLDRGGEGLEVLDLEQEGVRRRRPRTGRNTGRATARS